MMDAALAPILSRRSVREYAPDPLPPEQVRAVLEAGLNAPSAHDSRPWRFAVFTGDGKEALLSALSGPFRRDMEAAGLPPETVSARLARSQRIFRAAPVLVVGLRPAALPANPLDPTGALEETLAVQSAALAGGQMLLAAHALGLGACWFAAPLFCPEEVCAACGLDGGAWRPQYLLTLGVPAGAPPREKRPVSFEESVTFI